MEILRFAIIVMQHIRIAVKNFAHRLDHVWPTNTELPHPLGKTVSFIHLTIPVRMASYFQKEKIQQNQLMILLALQIQISYAKEKIKVEKTY